MTTPNVHSRGAESEPVPAQVNDASHQTDQLGDAGKWGGRLDKSFWLNYTLIGAGLATILGVLILLWGTSQNNLAISFVGACLLSVGTLGWMVAFFIFTVLLIRDVKPLIVRGLNGIRQFFEKSGPQV